MLTPMIAQNANERIVAAHQPNFFPWLPYFEKIVHSDVFVVLDDVQYPRSSKGTWINRVNVLNAGKPQYITAPIRRPHDQLVPINEVQFAKDQPWREKMSLTLKHLYGKAPFCRELLGSICDLVCTRTESLAEYNLHCIRGILTLLSIDVGKLVLASPCQVESQSAQRIADLVHKVGGTTYYSGQGAVSYQDAEFYKNSGIRLVYQKYEFQAYPQIKCEQFVPGLSVIDALLHCGIEGTRSLLRA